MVRAWASGLVHEAVSSAYSVVEVLNPGQHGQDPVERVVLVLATLPTHLRPPTPAVAVKEDHGPQRVRKTMRDHSQRRESTRTVHAGKRHKKALTWTSERSLNQRFRLVMVVRCER